MSSSLYTLTRGEDNEFFRLLSQYLGAEDARKLMKYPKVLKSMETAMREHPIFHLVHGRFHTLAQKIKMVKAWPGISDRFTDLDFKQAVEEARKSGKLRRFEVESPKNPLLNVVVSVYLDGIIETFGYALDRMHNVFGDKFKPRLIFEPNVLNRLIVPNGWTDYKRIKIEVVDLGAKFNRKNGFSLGDINYTDLAHVQVLFSGAQDPEWVRQMDPDRGIPNALIGGFLLGETVGDRHAKRPLLYLETEEIVRLVAHECLVSPPCSHDNVSLPVVWK